VILGDEDGIVVLPGHMAEEIYDECVRHDQIEAAILEHTQAEGISPKTFYPFNEETERIYAEWKFRHGV
jgi:regulator of RNase E activity RraA